MSGLRVPVHGSPSRPRTPRACAQAIARVIERAWFVLGPEVEAFEREFAAASGAPHAVGIGNGTDAIALILRALGIGAGDEVITTPLSAAYTALAIVMAGARPVFADIDPERMTLDPAAAERAITAARPRCCPFISTASRPTWRRLRRSRDTKGSRAGRRLLPGAPRHLRGTAGRHVRRRRRIQLLSDEESRRARRWRRGHHARCRARRAHQAAAETADRPIAIITSRLA